MYNVLFKNAPTTAGVQFFSLINGVVAGWRGIYTFLRPAGVLRWRMLLQYILLGFDKSVIASTKMVVEWEEELDGSSCVWL